MKRRVLAIAMAFIMLAAGLTGCKSTSEEAPAEPTTTAAVSKTAVESTADKTTQTANYDHAADHEKFKIGLAFADMSNENLERIDYLKNYIAPKYNVEFIVSEALDSAEAELNFIENAQISGAKGILSFAPTYWEQAGNKCQELGIYYAVQRTADTKSIDGLEFFCGGFGSQQSSTAAQMKIAAENFLGGAEKHGILIPTLLACKNNEAHRLNATAIMEAVEEAYGLKFTKPIDELIVSGEPTMAENDKGIDVYLYPGEMKNEDVITGISAALLTGKYDIVMGAGNTYTQLSQIIDEAERSFNKNIMVASVGELSESLHTAMNTDDCTGNKALDFAVVKSTTVIAGEGFAILMNGLLGDSEVLKPEGKAMKFQALNWGCDGPQQLAEIEQLDQDESTYVFNSAMIDKMIKKTNPTLTNEEIHSMLGDLTLYNCLKTLGLTQ
jgi:hypothetical protein